MGIGAVVYGAAGGGVETGIGGGMVARRRLKSARSKPMKRPAGVSVR